MSLSGLGLIVAAQNGDRGALEQLLEQSGPVVRASLFGRIDTRWRRYLSEDDVMQETYADAFLALSSASFVDSDSFLHWLKQLASHNLIDAIRGLKADRRGGSMRRASSASSNHSVAALFDLIDSKQKTASSHAMKQESIHRMVAAIEHLPDVYRDVIQRFDLRQESAEDIARQLQCSQGAVYMRRSRGHDLLRAWLCEETV